MKNQKNKYLLGIGFLVILLASVPQVFEKNHATLELKTAQGQTESIPLTGPRKAVDCKGIGTGQRLMCSCEYSNGTCTDSDCF